MAVRRGTRLVSLGRDVVYIEWNTTDGRRNGNFLTNAGAGRAGRRRWGRAAVVFLCRSGNRSIGAAVVATEAGIAPAYNVLDGFEVISTPMVTAGKLVGGQSDCPGNRDETG